MIFALLASFFLSIDPNGNESYINFPYENCEYLIIDPTPNCVVLSTYFAINFIAKERETPYVSYDDLKLKIDKRFGRNFCSLQELQSFLGDFNIKTKSIRLKDKSAISDRRFQFLILYIDPIKNAKIGHFAFCSNINGVAYLWDPMSTNMLKCKLTECKNLYNRWDGYALWIEK